ncbi:large conductance mechanosensitive channel protein MscL [Aquihabitans sp. McL0605]|uniref:large conductance mechanosensitive channel protein MscL n=1 Tax=Aquihabitans sp. McL0605 TaxID=3415671 RepID=UPI003CED3B9A
MLEGFKKFVMKGNVVDLAVGVVIGAAFGAVVKQFTDSFISPLIRLITGGGIKGGSFTIDGQVFDYAAFISALITFVITAAAIYFVVVVPMNALNARRARGEEPEGPTEQEQMIALLQQIADKPSAP